MALGKLLYLSVPQFPNLQNGDDGGIYLIGLLGGLNTLICVQHVEQCLWQGQPARVSPLFAQAPQVMILVLAVLAQCSPPAPRGPTLYHFPLSLGSTRHGTEL